MRVARGMEMKKTAKRYLTVLFTALTVWGGCQQVQAFSLSGGWEKGLKYGLGHIGEQAWERPTPIHIAMVTPYDEIMVERICRERESDEIHVIVSLKTRTLFLCCGNQVIDSFIAQVGAASREGDKEWSGDMRTPRGDFYVCLKNENSQYYKALGLSYPDKEDAERGWEAGVISEEEKAQIVRAIDQGVQPDWSTALGGAIEIHGEKGGLTDGCVAVGNPVMDCLWPVVAVGSRVRIY